MLKIYFLISLVTLAVAIPVQPAKRDMSSPAHTYTMKGRSDEYFVPNYVRKHHQRAANLARNKQHPEFESLVSGVHSSAQNLATRHALKKRQEGGYADLVDAVDNSATDLQYLTAVSIGSPTQSFLMVMDTGSSDLWVFGEGNNGTHTFYKPENSSTFETNNTEWRIEYGYGKSISFTAGYAAKDKVVFAGLDAGVSAFAVATSASDDNSKDVFDGLMGLGFSVNSAFFPSLTPFETLITTGAVAAPYFAMVLSRGTDEGVVQNATGDPESMKGLLGGQLTLGVLPNITGASYVPEFEYLPVQSPSDWTINMTGLSVGGVTIPGTSAYMVVDSGTTNNVLPVAVCDTFAAKIGASAVGDGSYTIPVEYINETTSIGIVLGNKTFDMDINDLITGYTNESALTYNLAFGSDDSMFMPDNVTAVGLIGDAFLKNVVTVFSYAGGAGEVDFPFDGPSIGFAQITESVVVAGNPPANYSIGVDPLPSTGTTYASVTVPYSTSTPSATSTADR